MIVVLTEKPSVAREFASVLGATARRAGFLEGNGYRVTWAIGHLVGVAQPAEIDPAWARWDRAPLPMSPETFPLTVLDSGQAQYRMAEREFGLPVTALPERDQVAGRLERLEAGDDHRDRAIVSTKNSVHILSVPERSLQCAVGEDVTLEKTAGQVRITPVRELGRKHGIELAR